MSSPSLKCNSKYQFEASLPRSSLLSRFESPVCQRINNVDYTFTNIDYISYMFYKFHNSFLNFNTDT